MAEWVLKTCFLYLCYCCWTITAFQPILEQRLHHFLIKEKKYNKLVRPFGPKDNGKLMVKMGIRLSQILDVSEKNQILTSNLWLRHEWRDSRLTWNPHEFGGINLTHIPSDDLWRPDIILYNNADGDYVITLLTKATVYHTGVIIWEPPAIYKSYCPINVEFFPFDQQDCFMKFGCWTHNGDEVDLQHVWQDKGVVINENITVILNAIDLCEYGQHVEWDIINVTASRRKKFYPCCPELYLDVTFNITLRRRTLFYTINLILPCVAISALTVLVFYLPSDSGEKITLSISILLALTVFFLLLSDINPPTSLVIPLIGKYLLFTMIVVSMSIFLTVYTLSVRFRSPDTHEMSPWTKRVFTEILPRILCMERPGMTKSSPVLDALQDVEDTEAKEINTCVRLPAPDPDERPPPPSYANVRRRKPLVISREMRERIKDVKFIAEHLRQEDEEILEEKDWNYVAMVMDRLFLVIFTTACVCGTIGIYLNAPSLYDPRKAMGIFWQCAVFYFIEIERSEMEKRIFHEGFAWLVDRRIELIKNCIRHNIVGVCETEEKNEKISMERHNQRAQEPHPVTGKREATKGGDTCILPAQRPASSSPSEMMTFPHRTESTLNTVTNVAIHTIPEKA